MSTELLLSVVCVSGPLEGETLMVEGLTLDSDVCDLAEVIQGMHLSRVPPQKRAMLFSLAFEDGTVAKFFTDYWSSVPRVRLIRVLAFGQHVTCRVREVVPPIYDIFVKGLAGKPVLLGVSRDATIDEVHALIEVTHALPLEEQRLVFGGKQLEPGRTLSDYNIQAQCTLDMVLRLRGGIEALAREPRFVDVSRTDALETQAWSKSGPAWWVACDGINIEGCCTNAACAAQDERVISHVGFGEFDLVLDKVKCPMCAMVIQPETPGFANCIWRASGVKDDGTSVFVGFRPAGNAYTTYKVDLSGCDLIPGAPMVKYRSLQIQARAPSISGASGLGGDDENCSKGESVTSAGTCLICHEGLNASRRRRSKVELLQCSHTYHKACLLLWWKVRPVCAACEVPVANI